MTPRTPRSLASTGASLLLALACGSQLPAPPTGAHQGSGANPGMIVNHPPPPARIECVPEQPSAECVWVDGSWRWAGRRWEWVPGAWVEPPMGCYYAPAYAEWLSGGVTDNGERRDQLFYFPPAWYPSTQKGSCPLPRLCRQATPADEC
jgi:hypothetical protein